MKDLSHYSELAAMFRYPDENLKHQAIAWRKIIEQYDQGLSIYLTPFINHLENTTLEYQQEYYVSTFYVQPVCCLEIGYVLFGEDFKRGQFLANLKTEHRNAGNDCGTELPDNLTVLLTLLPKLANPRFAEELAFSLMIPAVREIIARFMSVDNYYKSLLILLATIMETDFPESEFEKFSFENHKPQPLMKQI